MSAKPWVILPLVLPVGDKKYEIAPIEYQDGLTLIGVMRGDAKKIKANSSNEDLFKLVMGGTWDAMLADRLPFPVMFRAGVAATQYQMALVNDQSAADAVAAGELVWESGISPEAVAAAMAAKQAQTPGSKGSPRSLSTGSATRTRSPAPTRSTTSRKVTPRAGKPQPRGSGGRS